MDLLRLHVVVSQFLTKVNLARQSKAMLRIPHLDFLLDSSHPWGSFILFVGIFLGHVDGGEVPV